MASPAIEIVYERPAAPVRAWGPIAGGALFVVVVLWVTERSLPGPGWFALAVGLTAAIYAAQSLLGGGAVLSTRRVIVDPSAATLRIEHRRGERELSLSDIAGIAHGKVTSGDGVALDAVTLTLRDGSTVALGVASPEAAEGAARAIRALMEATGREAEAEGDQSA